MLRKCCVLGLMIMLVGCSVRVSETTDVTEEITMSVVETEVAVTDYVTDIAFGVPCVYVESNALYDNLVCAKGVAQEEWATPEDGWRTQEIDGHFYIHQVYADDILLLPVDYSSDVYTVIGLDGELPAECNTCPTTEEDAGVQN